MEEEELAAELEMLDEEHLALVLVRLPGNPLQSLRAARRALDVWADQEQGAYRKKEKALYAVEVDDLIRRVAADIASPSDTGASS